MAENPIIDALKCHCQALLKETRICKNEHTMCSKCAEELNRCPSCRGPITSARNYVMQHIAEAFQAAVSDAIPKPDLVPKAEAEAPNAEAVVLNAAVVTSRVKCPKCDFEFPLEQLVDHIAMFHEALIYEFSGGKRSTNFYLSRRTCIRLVRYTGSLFVIHIKFSAEHNLCYVKVAVINNDGHNYRYKVNRNAKVQVIPYENFKSSEAVSYLFCNRLLTVEISDRN